MVATSQLLASSEQWHAALQVTRPRKIAVAYLGWDWRSILPEAGPLSIQLIVSPRLGTNPDAVALAVAELGWDNVHFLEELHSKIYIGIDAALIGSANLTRNAFGVPLRDHPLSRKLLECGTLITGLDPLLEINQIFEHYLAIAKSQFSDTKAKEKRLNELRMERARVPEIRDGATSPLFVDFDSQASNISFVWWWPTDTSLLDQQVVKKELGIVSPDLSALDALSNWFSVTPDDEVKQGTWVLLWKASWNGLRNKAAHPQWMFVHEIFENAFLDATYSKVVAEVNDRSKPLPPFQINKSFRNAFDMTVQDDRFGNFRNLDETVRWTVKSTRPLMREFLEAMKSNL